MRWRTLLIVEVSQTFSSASYREPSCTYQISQDMRRLPCLSHFPMLPNWNTADYIVRCMCCDRSFHNFTSTAICFSYGSSIISSRVSSNASLVCRALSLVTQILRVYGRRSQQKSCSQFVYCTELQDTEYSVTEHMSMWTYYFSQGFQSVGSR